jgi:hypothetical protein
MRKSQGKIIIEWYDDHGHKEGEHECKSYLHARRISKLWESKHPGNSAVITHILYNTKSNVDKWTYIK